MCLILFAFQSHPQYPLIVAANRDEYYARATHSAHFWQDHPDLFGGRDMEAGGTWMGITRSGRFAAITNYREIPRPETNSNGKPLLSRGELTASFLKSSIPAENYVNDIMNRQDHYAGFNLLVGDPGKLLYCSNRMPEYESQLLTPGVYGLSNALLDEPWPKVELGKKALRQIVESSVDPEQLLAILLDTTPANDEQLPDTGIGLNAERVLSSRFIQTEHYGTRTSSVLMVNNQREVLFWEQNVDPKQGKQNIKKVQFRLS